MSGKLPKWHGVPWRGDSGLTDGCDVDYDLTGGFYDAGDFVKFHFPQSFALTVLGWGAIEFKDGYEQAGEYQHILNLLKWGIDHFKKCHARDHPLYPNIFWGQIGHGATDHAYLGRPEDMSMKRPAYEISSDKPGSELAAGASAVMAVGAQLFAREGETDYANDCIVRARELLSFAVDYQKNYHLSITDATDYYKSWSGFNDEIVLAGGLIAKASKAMDASNFEADKARANELADQFPLETGFEFSWDNKSKIEATLYNINLHFIQYPVHITSCMRSLESQDSKSCWTTGDRVSTTQHIPQTV